MRLLVALCILDASVCAEAAEVSDGDAEQFYESTTPPETIPEILKLFRAIATKGIYWRDDFYTVKTMQQLFGEQRPAKIIDDGIVTVVSVHGWEPLVIGPNEYTRSMPYTKGVSIEARRPDPNVQAVWRRLDVSFWGQFDGLDFESVTQVLGPGWKHDTAAERQPQPHRVPSPITGYMGDSIITYPAGETRLVLEFDSAGQLHSMTAGY